MFEKCGNCGARVVKGRTDQYGTFCSSACHDHFVHPGFCASCLHATTEVSSGGTFTFNGIGTRLYGSGDPCPVCRSVVQRLFFCVIFIPLIPIAKYRVKYVTPGRFLSRRLAPNVPQ
jgi:hypothetical protein